MLAMILGFSTLALGTAANKADYALFSARGENFYYSANGGAPAPLFIKGINIGPTLPDTPLDYPSIPYEVCWDWFADIKNMNANAVKVFTVMNPDFYRALYDFNVAEGELFLMQGVPVNEDVLAEMEHAFDKDGALAQSMDASSRFAVDAVHGNTHCEVRGEYAANVSSLTIGYILGLEWDANFVSLTNEIAGKEAFTGDYLYTSAAEPFENFLAAAGDALIRHEYDNYGQQRPIAFLNYATTDVLTHEDEPVPYDDMAAINTENILAGQAYTAGMFAAVDVYPYYPEFMNVTRPYLKAEDGGSINTFKAYLRELKAHYSMPVVVAEFGLPTSRGMAHESVMGYNQGRISERDQGRYLLSMMQDIYGLDYAGGFIFIWQDEWFKRTWNIYNAPELPVRFLNVQSAEQRFGIAAYEPGDADMASYPDGSTDEWSQADIVMRDEKLTLYARQDEAFLYLMIDTGGAFTPGEDTLYIALSTTGGRGLDFSTRHGLEFSVPADFVLEIKGRDDTRLTVASTNDLFYYNSAYVWGSEPPVPAYEAKDSGSFNNIELLLSHSFKVPYEQEARPYTSYETGLLKYGNANPTSAEYDSLADFYEKDGIVELRLPFNLINIADPSARLAIGNFYEQGGIVPFEVSSFYLGAVLNADENALAELYPYELRSYAYPSYHKRLKESYEILKNGLVDISS